MIVILSPMFLICLSGEESNFLRFFGRKLPQNDTVMLLIKKPLE